MSAQTARQQVYAWVRGELDGQTTVRLPELTDRMVAHFSTDAEFVSAWLSETLRPIAYDAVQRVIAGTRAYVIIADEAVPHEEAVRAIKAKRPRWQAFLEHAGDRHVRLFEMTRQDLLLAADEREKRGAAEMRLAALWRYLAEQLNDSETVGQHFTEAQIADIAGRLNVPTLKEAA